jgi:hypothetical protein
MGKGGCSCDSLVGHCWSRRRRAREACSAVEVCFEDGAATTGSGRLQFETVRRRYSPERSNARP